MPHKRLRCSLAFSAVLWAFSTGTCGAQNPIHVNPLRDAFFGELHLHTNYSFDAYLGGPREIDPDLAYRFARGEPVRYGDHTVKRRWALDFAAVTDHGEYLGVLADLDDMGSALSKSAIGRSIRAGNKDAIAAVGLAIAEGKPFPGFDVRPIFAAAWQKVIDAANENYRPGTFTTFIGYEWTSFGNTKADVSGAVAPDGSWGRADVGNLHRNVIFRGDTAPLPFTAVDSAKPEDLWEYLEVNRSRGIEALAIPHNANWSNGLMYDWVTSDGQPIDRRYALRRAFNEPLAEISQTKGQSETNPLLAPADEFADFEVRDDFLRAAAEWKGKDGHGSSIREAYGRGLIVAHRIGVNPYKFGVVGGSDFHNGLTTSDENAFSGLLNGAHGGVDPTQDYYVPEIRQKMLNNPVVTETYDEGTAGYDPRASSGSLTGVWAEENTRESIYDALRRKETFATSGTRLKMRIFGGWDYPFHLLHQVQWLKRAYAHGVPMGGDLPPQPAHKRAPRFAIWAVKDPDGANLDRVQIIKVWIKNDQLKQKVFDVAFAGRRVPDIKTGTVPAVGNTVDLKTATYENRIGSVELSTVWEDPQFDPTTSAAYYARVIEIPTPRWTTIRAAQAGVPLPKGLPATIQERGWSSPIWYTAPPNDRRKR
jgi:hypothetical protein